MLKKNENLKISLVKINLYFSINQGAYIKVTLLKLNYIDVHASFVKRAGLVKQSINYENWQN